MINAQGITKPHSPSSTSTAAAKKRVRFQLTHSQELKDLNITMASMMVPSPANNQQQIPPPSTPQHHQTTSYWASQQPSPSSTSQSSVSYQPPKRLLIFHETKNPQNAAETVYIPVNAAGLPICGPGPTFSGTLGSGSMSVLDLPLRIIKAFTELFNHPRYKNWAIVGAGPYHDRSEDGKFYAVVLEQIREQGSSSVERK